MTTRSSSRTVTFRSSFLLPGMAESHAPGSFEVHSEEEAIDVLFPASWVRMSIEIPVAGGVEAYPVTADELEAALMRDNAPIDVAT
ncbi:hypothetical protein [Devosia sp. CAU 1758]